MLLSAVAISHVVGLVTSMLSGSNLLVHHINLRLVGSGSVVPLQLHRGCQGVTLWGERLRADEEVLRLLEGTEIVLLGESQNFFLDGVLDLRVAANFLEVTLNALVSSPWLQEGLIGNHDRNDTVLERVSIDETLRDKVAETHDSFNLFGGNVFTLGQLEDILGPVDDLD